MDPRRADGGGFAHKQPRRQSRRQGFMLEHREQRHAVRYQEPGKIYDREKQVRDPLGDRRNCHPAGQCPTRMTLPSLSDAASFTNATTACVRSSCVTPAMGDRSAANAPGSNGRRPSDAGAIALTPAPGRSSVKASKPLALSIGVTLSHAEWLCQPPWIRTKTALLSDIAEPSSCDFAILRPV